MEWSKEQIHAHEDNFDKFREKYIKKENGETSLERIENEKRRCVTLIDKMESHPEIAPQVTGVYEEIARTL